MASPTFTAPDVTSDTAYVLTLRVSDGSLSDTDTVTITVNNSEVIIKKSNTPPVADAGPDQFIREGHIVTLDGSGSSDPDGTIASYSWEAPAGSGIALSDPAAQYTTFTAPFMPANSNFTITLVVVDNDGLSDSDTVVMMAKNDTSSPKVCR